MHIVIVIDSYNDGNGGVIATKRLVNALRERGHKVSIIAAAGEDPEMHKVKGTYLPFVREALEQMGFLFGIPDKETLRKVYEDADLIQIQFPFYMAVNACKVAKEMGKPVIGAFHVQPQNIIAAMGKESKMMDRMFWAFFKSFLFKRVPIIHCPSKFSAELLMSEEIKAHLRVVSNGIPEEYVPGDYERPDWFGDKFVLLNIGRHAMEKRQSLLIEGVKRSRYKDNIQLMICGKGENTEKHKEEGKALAIPPFIEYISQEDKMRYLNTADLYVHGSVVELESLSCLEAIGCGLPCLIGNSNYSAAPQFALDERFLFEKDNPDDLARKIDYLYEHREEVRALKKKVLEEAEKYRFKKCVDAMEELYADSIEYFQSEEPVLQPGLA